MVLQIPSPLHKVKLPLLTEHNVKLFIKRDDLIHPEISGNKWRKLKYNIEKAKQEKKDTLLTFGGAFSNHIAATAAAGKLLNIKTIGIIRGEELENKPLNDTLSKAKLNGMELRFVSRSEYQFRYEKSYLDDLKMQNPYTLIVSEGGANYYGVAGCVDIVKEIEIDFDIIATACGTGTTMSGLILGLKEHQKAIGYSSLKGNFMRDEINKHLFNFLLDNDAVQEYQDSFEICEDYHFGGYGKTTQELFDFMSQFKIDTNIELDKVYTSKMFYGLFKQIKEGVHDNKTIVALHTGGLQGN